MKPKKKYNKNVIALGIVFCLVPLGHLLVNAEQPAVLLINEVMYHPTENEGTNEWIELYNPTSEPIDVTGWTLTDEKETDQLQADTDHGDGTTVVPPGGYALITDKGTTVYDVFTVAENAIRLSVDDSTLCGYGLNNDQEKILVKDLTGTPIDAIEWGADYDEVPGIPAPLVAKGSSLARSQDTDMDDSSLDFIESTTPTPGSVNIVTTQDVQQNNTDEGQVVQTPPVLITELYYHTHSNINNEFVRLCNPTSSPVDVSGWYLTDEPWKEPDDQAKIIFPDHTMFPANTSWFVTKNASDFRWETGKLPEYEYGNDSRNDTMHLLTYKTVIYSNTGGCVGLYTSSAELVDLVIYGTPTQYASGWDGPPVPASGQGVILKRNTLNGTHVDTNTASDWIHPRIYGIGQTELTQHTVVFTGEITTFVSPDNSFEAITSELRKATRSISFNIYEFTNPFLCDELIAALDRQVTVTVFLEGSPIGGIDIKEYYLLQQIEAHGGTVRLMVTDNENRVHARYGFDHAKYLIIDDETVVVESCNWASTGVPKDPTYGNREWGMIIRNKDVAAVFLQVFSEDSNPLRCDSYPLSAMNVTLPPDFISKKTIPRGSYTPRFTAQTFNGTQSVTPVFSPDTSEQLLCDAISNATTTIYIEQLYIYKDWDEQISPLVERLVNKSSQGVDIKVILDYNPDYTDTIAQLNDTKQYLEENGISVKFISTAWSPFVTVHNKGMIIDNTTVLVSSINWNQQSVTLNREAGVLVENPTVATYYAAVFLSDWNLDAHRNSAPGFSWADYKNLLLIAVVCTITGALVVRDWRKRKWR
jgi:phosphatidylserine/phosphatidylglycerophosphate/cardiolipin synthase-like enzyme